MPKVDTIAFGEFEALAQPTWGRLPVKDTTAHIRLSAQAQERILVLGSGEYVWSSFYWQNIYTNKVLM